MWPFGTKQQDHPELKEELLILCREWFKHQIEDFPEDERPGEEEIEGDIIQMRDKTLERVITTVPAQKCIGNGGEPDDEGNKETLGKLVKAYAGHENTTPIFTKLALSKIDEPRYQSGWALCVRNLW